MTFSPIPPTPKTATSSPCCTFARLSTAPTPVSTPQPMRRGGLEGDVLGDPHGLGLGHHGGLREDRGGGEVVRRLAADGEGLGDVAEALAAPRGMTGLAGVALPAVGERAEHDVIADLDRGDLGPDGLDDAGALVAHDQRGREGDRAVHHAGVAVADTRVLDGHADLGRAGIPHLDVGADLGLVTIEDDRSHHVPLAAGQAGAP